MTLDGLELLERTTMQTVVRAIQDYYESSRTIFQKEEDSPGNIAEDVLREAGAGIHKT
ncbi:MAG: SfiI family type II restriction endonuclease [Bacteroidota bacterium]|nr:SfiI family type II restriction endonuclease [Bacteroidota bacterium]MDE2834440.1 SfiI family type II restriction endonuclease [Bacteroidota bacterium]